MNDNVVAHDPVVGRYFVNHILRFDVLDDPRTTEAQDQLEQVQAHIEDMRRAIKSKTEILASHQLRLE